MGLLPVKAVRLALGELLAADVDTLAPVAANKIALIVAAFAQTENLLYADLTFATFTGGAAKAGAAGTQQAGVSPLTGDQVVTNLAPAGGWRWECTVAPVTPQTIYGFALVNAAEDELVATAQLITPVTISAVGDFFDAGAVELNFVLQPITP